MQGIPIATVNAKKLASALRTVRAASAVGKACNVLLAFENDSLRIESMRGDVRASVVVGTVDKATRAVYLTGDAFELLAALGKHTKASESIDLRLVETLANVDDRLVAHFDDGGQDAADVQLHAHASGTAYRAPLVPDACDEAIACTFDRSEFVDALTYAQSAAVDGYPQSPIETEGVQVGFHDATLRLFTCDGASAHFVYVRPQSAPARAAMLPHDVRLPQSVVDAALRMCKLLPKAQASDVAVAFGIDANTNEYFARVAHDSACVEALVPKGAHETLVRTVRDTIEGEDRATMVVKSADALSFATQADGCNAAMALVDQTLVGYSENDTIFARAVERADGLRGTFGLPYDTARLRAAVRVPGELQTWHMRSDVGWHRGNLWLESSTEVSRYVAYVAPLGRLPKRSVLPGELRADA